MAENLSTGSPQACVVAGASMDACMPGGQSSWTLVPDHNRGCKRGSTKTLLTYHYGHSITPCEALDLKAKLMRQTSRRGTENENYTASPASRFVSRGPLGRGEGLPDPLVSVKPDNVCTPPSGLLALLPQRLHARPPLFAQLLLHWREVIIHAPSVPSPSLLLQGKECPPRPGGEPCEHNGRGPQRLLMMMVTVMLCEVYVGFVTLYVWR